MKKLESILLEKQGTLYLNGVVVKKGDPVMLEGVEWKIVGTGRTPGRSQALFLWVRHERFGTSIFAPTLDQKGPYQTPRPVQPTAPLKFQYPMPEVVQAATIADLGNSQISKVLLARFKKEVRPSGLSSRAA